MFKKDFVVPSLALVIAIILLFVGSIPQEDSYHQFADQRKMLGVANFLNVVSNLAFALIAAFGFYAGQSLKDKRLRLINKVLFTGFFLLTLGSGYYHLEPNNITLVYDRLPMSLIFMSFFYDRVNKKNGFLAFILLNVAGIATVLYWIYSEQAGRGDLGWYAMVQFFPIVAIPLILWLYKSPFKHEREIIPIFLFFGIAKAAEIYDEQIYRLAGEMISGHTIKHLFMAAAGYYIVKMIERRAAVKVDEAY